MSGVANSAAFPVCPVPEHTGTGGIPVGLPREALLAELHWPSGRRVLVRRCFLRRGEV